MMLSAADPVFLMSWFKPLVFLAVLIGWAWAVSRLDKDAAFFYLPRQWWNLAQLGCGVIGFGLMLLIPIFSLGLLIGVVVLLGGLLGYAYYRNSRVPEKMQWSLSLDSITQMIQAQQTARAQSRATLTLLSQDESRIDVPSGSDPRAEAHAALERVLDYALPRGADRIDLAVDSKKASMSVRIDGVRYPQDQLDPQLAMGLIDYVKEAAGLDAEDRRKKQSGSFKIDLEGDRHTLDVTSSGSTRGYTLAIEIDAGRRAQMPLTHLGLLDQQKEQLKKVIQSRGKVVLVAAPPRHGGTTTLYSLLQEEDPYTASVVTLEDEKVFELEGVSHNVMPDGFSAAQFNEKLSVLLRSDPQVMLVSRLVDQQTAKLAAQAADEVRFYIPIPRDDTFAGLKMWVKVVGDARQAAQGLGAIVSQRLVRKLCTTCRTPYKPEAAALKKLNLSPEKVSQFYHASGQVVVKGKPQPCPACLGLGYRGRTGVFELMVLDDQARKHIAAGETDKLRTYLRKRKMLWLQEAGLAKVVEGVTDIKEVTRALAEKGDAGPTSSTRSKSAGSTPRSGTPVKAD